MKAVIFDFDATLYKYGAPITELIEKRTDSFLLKHGVEDTKEFERNVPNILEALDVLGIDRSQYVADIFEDVRYEEYFREDTQLVKWLGKMSCLKIIVSLSPQKHIVSALEEMKVRSCFNEIISVCDLPHIHNKLNIYQSVLKANQWEPKDVICIGDSYQLDLVPALELGIEVILIHPKRRYRDKHLEIQSFPDIKTCLCSLSSYIK